MVVGGMARSRHWFIAYSSVYWLDKDDTQSKRDIGDIRMGRDRGQVGMASTGRRDKERSGNTGSDTCHQYRSCRVQ